MCNFFFNLNDLFYSEIVQRLTLRIQQDNSDNAFSKDSITKLQNRKCHKCWLGRRAVSTRTPSLYGPLDLHTPAFCCSSKMCHLDAEASSQTQCPANGQSEKTAQPYSIAKH